MWFDPDTKEILGVADVLARGISASDESDLSAFGLPTIIVTPKPGDGYTLGEPEEIGGVLHTTWVAPPPPPLEDLKAAKIAAINALRDRKETEGFTYLGHVWDSDERSVTRIYGAVMAAQAAIAAGAPEAFAITWTFADNSTAELTAEQMIGAPVAMAARADALHQYARTLKQAVAEAEDEQALEAIDIEAGWPA